MKPGTNWKKRALRAGAYAVFVLASPLLRPAFAGTGGEIRGRVLDPSGATVVDATVITWQASQKVAGQARSDSEGRYRISNLQAGTFTLQAHSEYFESVSVEVTIEAECVTRDLSFSRPRRSVGSIEVVGNAPDILQEIPGSAYVLTREELQASNPIDANEVLRRVPGVNVREDSGPVAMRLNVGVRGLNPDRSRQLLVLEDGIPIALAPYGEPEMYYSPPIDRMRAVEVLKGSGQILYGPQTIGGVLNFLTPDPPPTTRGTLDLEGGQRGYFAGQASLGGSTRHQDAGWFLNYLRKQGDGFRKFHFDINDLQAKFTLKASENHQFGFKLGLFDEGSNSTYLGLTAPQFLADPNQNSVPGDFLKVRRESASLSHTTTLNGAAVLHTTFFAYHTVRDWRRQNFDRLDLGKPYLAVEGDPSVPGGAIYLLNSDLNRNRAFTVLGIQTGVTQEYRLGGIRNKLDAGIRYVYEETDDQEIQGQTFNSSTGALRADDDRFGKAFSAFVQNRIHLSRKFVFTPGVRLENYRYTRLIQRLPVNGLPTDVNRRGGDQVTKLIPGLGLGFNASSKLTLFTGVHRGFAPPRTKDAITQAGGTLDLGAELSWNYEAGVRFRPSPFVTGEVTYFRLDFENQIIPGAQSGGATTTLVNAGETLNEGIETSVRVDWGGLVRSPLGFYTDVRYTWIPVAQFTRNALYEGNRLPYAPKNTLAVLLGFRRWQSFGFQLDGTYVGHQFGDNLETWIPSSDGTAGVLPGYMLWNVGFDYTIRRERVSISPYVGIKNLTNRVYISSRAPQGIQPGLFRQASAGVKINF